MDFSNPTKFNILSELSDIYDIDTYISRVQAAGLQVRGSELEFAQKVGMVLYAKHKFPDKTSYEAYMHFATNKDPKYDQYSYQACCGGGQIK